MPPVPSATDEAGGIREMHPLAIGRCALVQSTTRTTHTHDAKERSAFGFFSGGGKKKTPETS